MTPGGAAAAPVADRLRRLWRRPGRAPLGVAVGALAGVLVAALVVPSRQHVVHVASGSGPGGRSSAAEAQAEEQSAAEQAALAAQGSAVAGSGAPGTAGRPGGVAAGAGGTSAAAGVVRGVTDTTVKIGVAYLDLGPVAYLGPEFDNGNVPQQWDAILDGWKRQGLMPVNGRTVQFVYRKYNVTDNAEQRAACVALVDDDKVFMVDAIEFFYQQGAECVAREHRTPLLTAEGPSDEVFARSNPYMFALHLSTSSILRNWVHWADAVGLLRGKKIGIYHLDDAVVQDQVDRNVKGELAKLGYPAPVEASTRDNLGGPEDAIAVQRFRTAGVNVVMLMTSRAGFQQQAAGQAYKPQYTDSDWDGGTSDALTSTYPADQFEGSLAPSEWKRGEPAAGYPLSAAEEACVTNYERYSGHKVARPGPSGHESAEWAFVVVACDEAKVLLQALQTAGRNLTPATFVAALESIRKMQLIRFSDVTFGPGKHAGADLLRTLKWSRGCTCWRAAGPFQPLFTP